MRVHAISFPSRALRLKRNKLTVCFASQVDDVCLSNDGQSAFTLSLFYFEMVSCAIFFQLNNGIFRK